MRTSLALAISLVPVIAVGVHSSDRSNSVSVQEVQERRLNGGLVESDATVVLIHRGGALIDVSVNNATHS